MLIYNYKKEFLGIDETDIKALGLKDLADLRAESADFADLFVKTPGHIHNFKHVHWIDYVLDDSGTASKAIINVKNKNFTTNIDIKTIYLVDNPDTKAYIVELTNLRPLSASQMDNIAKDIAQKPTPKTATGSTELFTTPGSIVHDEYIREEKEEVAYDPYESDDSASISVPDMYETQTPAEIDLAVDEAPLKIDVEDTYFTEPEAAPVQEAKIEEKTTPLTAEKKASTGVVEGKFADYVYDPHFASDELGLPVDLIQEFIEDFITQAESFKTELYDSAKSNDLDHLKVQSHKLKGVAANLRIQDALDALTVINSSEDYDEIKTNLDNLYIMIKKLSNKPEATSPSQEVVEDVKIENDDDEEEFVLSFKNDPAPVAVDEPEKVEEKEIDFAEDVILDADVPKHISMPELADDEFLNSDTQDISELSIDEELESFEELEDEDNNDVETYDKRQIASDFGLDIDSFNELFNDFMEESKELAEIIVQSADENNLTACKNTAIKMKGMSDNMRIHKFDDELEDIINSTTTQSVKDSINIVKSKLSKISTLEDK